MLTKKDLQQIGEVVKIESKKVVQTELKPIKKDIRTIKTDITKIRQDQNTIIAFFDKAYLELRTRVEKIEEFLNITTS